MISHALLKALYSRRGGAQFPNLNAVTFFTKRRGLLVGPGIYSLGQFYDTVLDIFCQGHKNVTNILQYIASTK